MVKPYQTSITLFTFEENGKPTKKENFEREKKLSSRKRHEKRLQKYPVNIILL